MEEKLIRPLGRAKGGEPSPRKLSRFEEGGRVEADYRGKGKYYPGKISRDRGDGTYDVDYDDGEKETSVEEKLIRPRSISPTKAAAAASRIKEGDKVDADYRGKGKYYPGKISRDRGDGTYDVDYDDGEKETSVEEKLIRAAGTNPAKVELGDEVEADYKRKGDPHPIPLLSLFVITIITILSYHHHCSVINVQLRPLYHLHITSHHTYPLIIYPHPPLPPSPTTPPHPPPLPTTQASTIPARSPSTTATARSTFSTTMARRRRGWRRR